MSEPRVVNVSVSTGKKLFWCMKIERQIIEDLCYQKYFSRGRRCRECLDVGKRQHWPEPWASIGKEKDKDVSPEQTEREPDPEELPRGLESSGQDRPEDLPGEAGGRYRGSDGEEQSTPFEVVTGFVVHGKWVH